MMPDEPTPDRDDRPSTWRHHAIEAGVGLAIALLLLWVAVAATTDVPFVYQGL